MAVVAEEKHTNYVDRSSLKLPPIRLPAPNPGAATPLPLPSISPSAQDINLPDHIHPDKTVRLNLLGEGSGGRVYLVKDKDSGEKYAVKVVEGGVGTEEEEKKKSEVEIMRRCRASPNIVRCYGGRMEKDGKMSVVLEYMDGGSLADVLDRHRVLSERHIAYVARHVLQALVYLRSQNIAHRDIKPSNILLNRRLHIKLADFGVSSDFSHSLASSCTSFVGTCAYMSPERFDPLSHGPSYCGPTADIWSLGLSLLECSTGHFPFLAPGFVPDWPSLIMAICYGEPPLPPHDASPQFRDFIMRCLQKDPARRAQAAALLTHPFVARAEGVPLDMLALLDSP